MSARGGKRTLHLQSITGTALPVTDFLILVSVVVVAVVFDWGLWGNACGTAEYIVKTEGWKKPLPLWLKIQGAPYRIGLGIIAWGTAAIISLWRPIENETSKIWLVIALMLAYLGVACWQFWKTL